MASMLMPVPMPSRPISGIDDAFDAVVLEAFAQVQRIVAGELAPAVSGDFAIPWRRGRRLPRWGRRCGRHAEIRVLDRCGADDDVVDAVVEIALDSVEIADAATPSCVNVFTDFGGIALIAPSLTGLPAKARSGPPDAGAWRLVDPVARHLRQVFRKHGDVVHVALTQANAMTVFEINRRNDKHGDV